MGLLALGIIAIGILYFLVRKNKNNNPTPLNAHLNQSDGNSEEWLGSMIENMELQQQAGKDIEQKLGEILIMLESGDNEKQNEGATQIRALAQEVLTKEKNGIRSGAAPKVIDILKSIHPEYLV
jgi:hypothetical protein